MKNYKLVLEYDGSRYDGWQRLGKGESSNTLENKLLDVLCKMLEKPVEVNCGARTEAGVHARRQVINFKADTKMKPYEMKHYCSRYLPRDMAVLEVEEMPERFHASLNAKEKTFCYRIAVGETAPVFNRKYVYYSFQCPDVKKMEKAAKALIGKYDFKYFSTVKKSKSTVKDIKEIRIERVGDEIQIWMTANDFLHNMPKILAGTLLEIGLGRREVSEVPDMISGAELPGPQAAACGLFLEAVSYEETSGI